MNILIKHILLFTIICVPLTSKAQEMITDRPDQTESSSAVPKGKLQWEYGTILETDQTDTMRRVTFIPVGTLIRYGLFENLELRLGTEIYYDRFKENVDTPREFSYTRKGLYPVYAGLKYQFLEQNSIIPEMALIAHLSFPQIASDVDAPDGIAPDVTLAASHRFRYRLSTAYNFGLIWDGHNTRPSIFWSSVLGIRHSLFISSFYELYGFIPHIASANDIRLDAGLTWLVVSNFQLDASAGMGLTEDAPDFFVSLGFSWRIPD